MSLEFVLSKIKRIPLAEKKLPIVIVNDEPLTWEQLLSEIKKRTKKGKVGQEKLEKMHLSEITEEQWKLIEARLKYWPEEHTLLTLGEAPLRKKDILEHVKKRDKIGKEFTQMQLEYIQWLLEGSTLL